MRRTILVSLVVLAGAGLASATFGDSSYVKDKCHELLAGVENEGHSHFEVAALCRARLPSNLCREGLNRLGKQPWSVETMRSACSYWDAEYNAHVVDPAPARRTQDLVAGIEYTMDKKHELGICKALSFEECVKYKAATYPEIAQNITRVIGEISADLSVHAKGLQGAQPTAVNDGAQPTAVNGEVLGTTTKQSIANEADLHTTQKSSSRQSHVPWAVASFAAGILLGV
mmetsp:Transcript_114292/g.227422  ORF Transcript_114292/g.227422 Transcript_114292/m.227422 type:complete len:229 (-) Transcript_114292:122-808(-)